MPLFRSSIWLTERARGNLPHPPSTRRICRQKCCQIPSYQGGKSVNLPPSDAARINGKWAVLAEAARWQRRQSSGSKAAAARQRQAARRRRRGRKDDGGSTAAAGRCLRAHGGSSVGAMSGADGRQDIGGSCYSRAVAAAAARQLRHLHEGVGCSAEMVAGQRRQRGGSRAVLTAAARWQRQHSGGDSAAAAGPC